MKAIKKGEQHIRIQIVTTTDELGNYKGKKISRNIMLYPEKEEIIDEKKLDEIEQKIRNLFEI